MKLKVVAIKIGDDFSMSTDVRDVASIHLLAAETKYSVPNDNSTKFQDVKGCATVYVTQAEAKKISLGDEYELTKV